MTAEIHITLLDKSEYDRWDHYVQNHPASTFYHRYEWKEVIEKSFGHKTYYLMANDKSKLVGVLPIIYLKSYLIGSIYCSMPFMCNSAGILADTENAEKALLSEAAKIVKKSGGDYLELRHKKRSSGELPVKTNKVSMTLKLDPDAEVLWNNFKTKHRTNIRRAYKNGMEIQIGRENLLDEFYRIISIGWRNLGTPIYRKSFFKNILKAFEDSIEIYVVFYNGKAIASAFNGTFRDTVEGMWTYSLRDFTRLQTNYFLYWEMIKRACEEGHKIYHLGRSTKDTGATFFKSKWNASLKQLYWEYVLNKEDELPGISVDNPRYKIAINIWRSLPVKTTQFLGPLIAKNIP